MKVGLLADIHGDVEHLKAAVNRLNRRKVDRFVVLGDVIFDRSNADETIALLTGCGAVGVWGNHELGLCVDPDDEIREMYSGVVLDFFATLSSHLELGDVLFSHTFPDQDPTDPFAYYMRGDIDEDGSLDASFSEYPHRVMMIGHFHRWFAATSAARIPWVGGGPLRLNSEQRYFFVINAVMNGWAAVFDSSDNLLTPIQL